MKTAFNNKKTKYKNLQLKALATDYLSNISLDGNSDYEIKKTYFEKIISNEFECFLNFNKISVDKRKQTDYFKYYKQKLLNENSKLTSARLDTFLKNEFNENANDENAKTYIEDILSKKNSKRVERKLVPRVTIIPSQSFENAKESKEINYKPIITDVEIDYLQKNAQQVLS